MLELCFRVSLILMAFYALLVLALWLAAWLK